MQLGASVERRHNAFFFQAPPLALRLKGKPVMRMRPEREHISRFFYDGECVATEHLDRPTSGKARQIELNHLREARQVHNN
ncbi:MAG: hypothetical protein DME41_03890 [Verrucomicrobia bacterium]|nr:MAG: hypothetical protein DME41_03890 [Verrucomicrobiota bacterium]